MSTPKPKEPVDVTRELSRVGNLTYQHRQLIDAGHCHEVFDQIKRTRLWFDLVLLAIAGLAAYSGCQTVASRAVPYGSATVFCIFASVLASRFRTVREVHAAIQDELVPDSSSPDAVGSVSVPLAANHMLTYAQKQKLKSGDAPAVARELASTARKNASLIALVLAYMLMQLVRSFFRSFFRSLREMDQPFTAREATFLGLELSMVLIPLGGFAAWQMVRRKRLTALAEQAETEQSRGPDVV